MWYLYVNVIEKINKWMWNTRKQREETLLGLAEFKLSSPGSSCVTSSSGVSYSRLWCWTTAESCEINPLSSHLNEFLSKKLQSTFIPFSLCSTAFFFLPFLTKKEKKMSKRHQLGMQIQQEYVIRMMSNYWVRCNDQGL